MVTTFKKNDKETLQIFTVTISSGQTVSNSFDLNGMTLVGIELPAAMTSNTMFIQDSTDDGVTFKELYNTSNSRIEWSITANKKYALLPFALTINPFSSFHVFIG